MDAKKRQARNIFLFLIIIAGLIFFITKNHNQWPFNKIGRDFTAYWASTRLLIDGENPYQSDKIYAVEKSVGFTDERPTIMYNPPWVLAFILPFSTSIFPLGKFLWLGFTFLCILISTIWLWQYYNGKDGKQHWILPILFSYVPFYYTMGRGQIVPLILLGIAGFLHLERQNKWFLAGTFVSLLMIKPQDTYLFLLAILLWSIAKKQWQLLAGAGFATLLVTAIPLFYNPSVFMQYYADVLTSSHLHRWETPTLGFWLTELFGHEKLFLLYVPTLVGIIWLLYHWHNNSKKWTWSEQTPLLILLSLMTTFYAWINDYLLIIVAIVQTVIVCIDKPLQFYSKLAVLMYLFIILMMWVTTFSGGSEKTFIWIVPALFINYLFVKYTNKTITQ